MKSVPLATLAICVLAPVIFLCPGATDFCIFDREAIARGEWYRFITGHLVHFSRSHLMWDVMVFAIAGAFIESRSRLLFMVLLLTACAAIGIALMFFAPLLRFYGGLSGLATACVFSLALRSVGERGTSRVCGIIVAAGVLAKLWIETFSAQSLFVSLDVPAIQPAPISHAAGMVAAVLVWFLARQFVEKRIPSCPANDRNRSHSLIPDGA